MTTCETCNCNLSKIVERLRFWGFSEAADLIARSFPDELTSSTQEDEAAPEGEEG